MKETLPAPARPLVVYVDSGQGSADDEADTDELAAAYLALGYVDGTNFRHVIQPGAAHDETYWAERFPGAMQLGSDRAEPQRATGDRTRRRR